MKTQKQAGFTLIEVMVSVVVLAIGLLGLAGLQATSMRFNSSAYLRSQATNLAYDIADRMRANVTAARNGNYIIGVGVAAPAGNTLDATDLQQWRIALTNILPAGTGGICRGTLNAAGVCAVAVGNVFTIRIQWDDSRGQDAPQQFDMMTEI